MSSSVGQPAATATDASSSHLEPGGTSGAIVVVVVVVGGNVILTVVGVGSGWVGIGEMLAVVVLLQAVRIVATHSIARNFTRLPDWASGQGCGSWLCPLIVPTDVD